MLGDTAKLMCDYNVAYKDLYKVVWHQNNRKIYQYVKGRTPPQTSYVRNLHIDLNRSDSINLVLKNANFEMSGLYSCEVTTESPIYSKPSDDILLTVMGHCDKFDQLNRSDSINLVLKNANFEMSGLYSCEVTTESPIYSKPSDDILLTVMESQKEDPQITFRKPIYSVGDQLEVNCTSGMATPTPDVTWLINGKQVQNGLVKSYQQKPSSVTVQLSFQLTDEHLDEINLTCMSTIPGFLGHGASHKEYADHRTQSVTVQVKAPVVVEKNAARGVTPCVATVTTIVLGVILQ
ncbi:uncharacterized protein LOC103516107, partial [Diaphorina citri]|uniref:Uncharacterized protein LOC103516107 n=1 Tax=Diaphorina citri TaxID=121845 RepID=A0A3Q0JBT2_DIACI